MHELKVRKVVDEDLALQDDDDAVAAEADAAHGGLEGELPDAAALVVVPDHHLVGRVVRGVPTADEREDVAPEEHLDDADAPALAAGVVLAPEVAAEDLAERVAVVDAEAGLGPRREAAVVLVEGDVEQVLGRGERPLDPAPLAGARRRGGGRRDGGDGRGVVAVVLAGGGWLD